MQPTKSDAYTTAVVDVNGTEVSTVGSAESAWFDASTIGIAERQGLNSWDGPVTLELYSVDGRLKADLAGPFGSMFVGLGHVAVTPHDAGLAPGDTFQLWDGDKLSSPIAGFPWIWSADGARLAVLHLVDGDYYLGPGDRGTVEVVDDHGGSVASFGHLVAALSSNMYFSPDDRYLAIDDVVDKVKTDPFDVVVDIQSGRFEKLAPTDPNSSYGFGWVSPDTFYMGSPDGPVTWNPASGYVPTNIPKGSVLAVADTGVVSYWSDSATRMTIRSAAKEQTVDLPGSITGATWSPDGTRLAVTYQPVAGSTTQLTMLQAPDFAFPRS